MKRLDMSVFCLLLGVVSSACSSSSGGGGGFGEDAGSTGCSSDSDCKGSRVCKNGTCVDTTTDSGTTTDTGSGGGCGSLKLPGQPCSVNTDCCQSSSEDPLGAICASNDSVCHAICHTNSECSSGCCANVTGTSYGACASATYCQVGIGDACSSGSSCKSGECAGGSNGWCTTTCSQSTPDCNGDNSDGTNAYGNYNFCVKNSGGSYSCFPGCSSSADCAPYPGTTCHTVTTASGATRSACST